MDDDPATWGRPEKSCASLFLNVFLHQDLLAAAELSDFVGRPDYARECREKAGNLAAAIQKHCWDERGEGPSSPWTSNAARTFRRIASGGC